MLPGLSVPVDLAAAGHVDVGERPSLLAPEFVDALKARECDGAITWDQRHRRIAMVARSFVQARRREQAEATLAVGNCFNEGRHESR